MKQPPSGLRLLPLIGSLSPSELRNLRDIVISEDKRAALLSLIESTLRLHSKGEQMEVVDAVYSDPAPAGEYYLVHPDEETSTQQKEAFYMLLMDRGGLPTSQDLIRLVNRILNLDLPPLEVMKKSRMSIIDRAWDRFTQLSKKEKSRIMNELLRRLPDAAKGNSEYQRLFRFLTRDERRG
ncbi:MAG: hypothetical protein QM715_00510 [Nibricoccus sp.]